MSVMVQLEKQINESLKAADVIAAQAESEKRNLTGEEMTMITKAFEDAGTTTKLLREASSNEKAMKEFNALGLEVGATAKGGGFEKGAGKSVGEMFANAETVSGWLKSFPNGRIPESAKNITSPPIAFGGIKDILSGGNRTNGPGLLVESDRLGLIDQGRFARPLTIRDLVGSGTTTSDTVEYVLESSYTNNAAPVAEARGASTFVVAAGNVEGRKPESAFTLSAASAGVKTIAHWIPVTKRALSDASQIRSLIDNFLRYGLEEELEDQMANGSGTGENFTGFMNTSGVQSQAFDTNLLTTARKAKTKVRLGGRTIPQAYLLNPADNEKIDLTTNAQGDFIFGSPTGNQVQTLWGLPRIESEAIPAGTGVVADFRRAILWDQEQASIVASDSHADFFTRNLIAILAEMRAAFTVIRPSAFCKFATAATV